MPGARLRAAGPPQTGGPRGPERPQGRRQQLLGKQPAPRPRPRSQEKKKVNCKPKNQDEQEIPFRLREIMRSRQEMKNAVSNKKRKKEAQAVFRRTLEKEARGVGPDIPVPKFKRRKWESDAVYIQRMEQEAQHVLFLSKNQADQQPEAEVAPKKKSEGKKAFQKRRRDRVRRKREEKAEERLEQELLRDTVKFGEVALQPPELTAQPRKSGSAGQPGKKSLMLAKLLGPGGVARPPPASMARQRIVAEERARAVQAYRAVKAQRQAQGPPSAHLPPRKKPETRL
ncbi:coiled-coil domain-containing protein 137 [Pipistrellus kuhlii]|uniref:Coiled-coil domain containing 137 n=1 Tax=Pipistrellus kuhlii TaxID=59472 RepID=A0A7J7SE69_PIPKU|nr:coiled-coil domain-containing protein 137 [Pipistrellus kuhlii]KAF6286710.1 coiled-coil domain containing 137 [Pipistrellus kuhlii]